MTGLTRPAGPMGGRFRGDGRWVEIFEQGGAWGAYLHSKLLTGKFAEARRRVEGVKFKATYGCPMDPDRFLEVEMEAVYEAVLYWLNKGGPDE